MIRPLVSLQMKQRIRAETSSELHSTELGKSMLERAVEEDVERERERLDRAQAKLAQTQARRTKEAAVQEARARRILREMKNDVKREEVRRSDGWGSDSVTSGKRLILCAYRTSKLLHDHFPLHHSGP